MRVLAGLVSGAIGAAACTSEPDGPIDYRVTGGFGGAGDGTVLHIELDGRMTRTVQGATETVTLDAATVADLRDKIAAAKFPTLEPRYACGCADDFTDVVSVRLDGATHTVAADQTAAVPGSLKLVIDTLHQIYERPLGWR